MGASSTNPYTSQTISNYNASPPPDDGTQTVANQLSWSKHKTKLADPIKTLAEGINTAVSATFAKTINTDANVANQISGSLALEWATATIGTDSISPTYSAVLLGTESGATSDTLQVITATGVYNGALLNIRQRNATEEILLVHATSTAATATGANIYLRDFTKRLLNNINETVTLQYDANTASGWVETNNSGNVINTGRATVASAATTADIWGAAGNQIDWTGTTTCTGFPAAPRAGASRTLICAAAAPFTAGANMLIDGVTSGNTVTCAANDIMIVRAVTTTQFRLSRVKYDGKPQVGLGVAPTVQIFTSSGTYTKPAGLVAAIVEVCGGGGGGGGVAGATGNGSGGGGGGASTMRRLLASAIGATETVTVGAGGAGGDTAGGDGATGGTSSFGSLVDAPGGGGGGGASGGGFDLGGIGGVTGTNGDVFFEGGDGAGNVFVSSTLGIAGGGGPSRFGGGGRGRNSNGAGVGDAGGQFGGGGGGSYSTGSAHVGGAGAAGVVIVTEYY